MRQLTGGRVWLQAVVVCVLAAVSLPASAAQPGKTAHAERLSFDPQTGRWVRVAAPVPGTPDGELALARAMLAKGQSRQALKKLKRWLGDYPDSPRYAEALFCLAEAEFQRGRYFKAYQRYEELLDGYPGTALTERALRRELAIAEAFLSGRWRRVLRILRLPAYEEALDMLDNIAVSRAPGSGIAERAIKLRADYFYRHGDFAEAEQEYARLAREFPHGRYAGLASLRSAQSALASFPGIAFDEAPLIEAETRFRQVAQQYPQLAGQNGVPELLDKIRTTRAQKEYQIARWYEKTKRYQAAAYYYRMVAKRWPDTHYASLARQRLARLAPPAEAPAEGPAYLPKRVEPPIGVPLP